MSDDKPATKAELIKRAEDVRIAPGGIQIETGTDLITVSEIVAKSGLAPKGMQSASQIFVAMQTGAEAGLSPMQSLRAIYVVAGSNTPSWRAEAVNALIRRSPRCEWLEVGIEGQGEKRAGFASCKLAERADVVTVRFSVDDAKQAKLWGKKGPRGDSAWVTFPDDMLVARAVTRFGRQYFPEVLLGLPVDVEVRERPAAYSTTPEAPHRGAPPSAVDPLLEGEAPTIEAKVVESGDSQGETTETEVGTPMPDSTAPPEDWTAPSSCPSCQTPASDPDQVECGVCGLDWQTGEIPNG